MTATNADLLRMGWLLSWAGYSKLEVIWEWRVKTNLTRTQCQGRWDSLVEDKLIFYRCGDGWKITPEGFSLLDGGDQTETEMT